MHCHHFHTTVNAIIHIHSKSITTNYCICMVIVYVEIRFIEKIIANSELDICRSDYLRGTMSECNLQANSNLNYLNIEKFN